MTQLSSNLVVEQRFWHVPMKLVKKSQELFRFFQVQHQAVKHYYYKTHLNLARPNFHSKEAFSGTFKRKSEICWNYTSEGDHIPHKILSVYCSKKGLKFSHDTKVCFFAKTAIKSFTKFKKPSKTWIFLGEVIASRLQQQIKGNNTWPLFCVLRCLLPQNFLLLQGI